MTRLKSKKTGQEAKFFPKKEKKSRRRLLITSLQREKEILSKVVVEKSLPSPSKLTPNASTQKDQLKKAVREKEREEFDEDYIFEFMDHYIRKPMEKGIDDIIQC
ncbi:hypothetical protein E5676_scaffold1371G00370 [Cucumis melo var. makuwa]|uniref:Uncharacterized protein n=1 Tax=Cucumis melo var. makuwa TaxID=1194695 RepID=A0A5A7UCY8_CUCMM|nr:hypothetical protein E6C27_scaffold578G00490 [Cucumis melo var. makuwa]TYK00691.1 hypothetical protein E5676_scaffold1371G00370 [Cucumis melo var. makuwa]